MMVCKAISTRERGVLRGNCILGLKRREGYRKNGTKIV
jgi:hypothetical protein